MLQHITSPTKVALLVEDDFMVREFLQRVLEADGSYRVLTATDGEDALAVSREWRGGIDILISDVNMPRMNGIELARRFGQCNPGTPVLLITGYGEPSYEHASGWSVLLKPFLPSRFLRAIRESLPVPMCGERAEAALAGA